ncbi:UspA domain-containing protein [Halorubrum lipolyticum]|uniref:UspA domain-containing protein n=1 Tax=Halorubrum lipolyticum DSM 21995 TaxID=1227482 RepID=M0NUF6_9EURY|nr:UspA domain-containing protein [Halorubrum lipolyticum]EMA60250.1 UspA domain-containing protein [Halorubrum lipolyticum DSM 21995]
MTETPADDGGAQPESGEDPATERDPATEQPPAIDRPSVLVPLAVLEGESLPNGTPELLANAHVVLLGYHAIPEQTAAEQAREQFGETAMSKLDEFADRLAAAGAEVETRLVFTHDEEITIDRLIYEYGCLAVLVPNSTECVDSVFVALRGTVGVGRNTRLVAGLFADGGVDVTLYHALDEGETPDDGESFLNGVKADLVERGIAPDRIETLVEDADASIDAIAGRAESHDAVVMGETDPSVTTFVFGMPSEQVAERFLGPVLVVQRERPEE